MDRRNEEPTHERYGDRYNYEGYRDRTAEVAIRNVENEMKRKENREKHKKQKRF